MEVLDKAEICGMDLLDLDLVLLSHHYVRVICIVCFIYLFYPTNFYISRGCVIAPDLLCLTPTNISKVLLVSTSTSCWFE